MPKDTNIQSALRKLQSVASNPAFLEAVEEAAQSPSEWRAAKANPAAYLRRSGVRVPAGVTVTLESPPRGLAVRAATRIVIRCVRICIRLGTRIVCVTICIIRRR